MSCHNSRDLIKAYSLYLATEDCFKVTQKAVDEERFLAQTEFLAETVDDCARLLREAREKNEHNLLLSLWTMTERMVVDFIRNRGRNAFGGDLSGFSAKYRKMLEKESEYWRMDKMLDLFKGDVDANLVGDIKNIKKYRDWIVHQNPRKPKPASIPPSLAYKKISDFCEALSELRDS